MQESTYNSDLPVQTDGATSLLDLRKVPSISSVKFLLLFAVCASHSIFEYLFHTFYLNIGFSFFHAGFTFVLFASIYLVFFVTASWRNVFYINKYSVLLLLIPVLFFFREGYGYVVEQVRFGRTYIELFFWFAFFYLLIDKVINSRADFLKESVAFLFRYYNWSVLFLSLFYVIVVHLLPRTSFVNYVHIEGMNYVSYAAISTIVLIMKYPIKMFSHKYVERSFVLFMVVVPFLVSNTGGIISLAVVLFIGAGKNMRAVIMLFSLLVLAVIYIFYRDIFFISFNYLYKLITYGLFDQVAMSDVLAPGQEAFSSTYIRNAANALAFSNFLSSPIIGVGLFEIKNVATVNGYWSHTWPIVVMASYGFVILMFIYFSVYMSAGMGNNFKKKGFALLFVFFMMQSLFVNEIYIFFVVHLILYRYYYLFDCFVCADRGAVNSGVVRAAS